MELKEFEEVFTKYDTSRDGFLDMMELKYMMEVIFKLSFPEADKHSFPPSSFPRLYVSSLFTLFFGTTLNCN